MKKESREIIRMLTIVLAVMMALPLAYRVWIHRHPPASEPRQTLAEVFAKAAEDRAVLLLQTPLLKWTDYDKRTEPRIYAWLEAHDRQVLPWEWTEEARRKDPDGYRQIWRSLFEEQRDVLDRRLKAEREALKGLERMLWIAEAFHAHRSNAMVRAVSSVATNSFRLTLDVEGLSARVGAARDRVEAIEGLISRNETVLNLGEARDSLFLSEMRDFLNAEIVPQSCPPDGGSRKMR